MKVVLVVGARPNYMKMAPIRAAMAARGGFEPVLVHTGQHYDERMSELFFRDLQLPAPDEFLNVGSGTHAEQSARVMLAFEPAVQRHRPDRVLVAGDVNSTMACALVCAKLGVPVDHVEAGLRSRDRSMPEEVNRVVTDHVADLLFTPSRDADENLRREGIAPERIHFVGNVMIDTLSRMLPRIREQRMAETLGLAPQRYALVTLHRPSNVDDPDTLKELLAALREIGESLPVLFPVHPRTAERMAALGAGPQSPQLRLLPALGYLEFTSLMESAAVVLTDSGGIQEETTCLGVPCLTLRPNTERPITIAEGTNRLVRSEAREIVRAFREALASPARPARAPERWDGRAAERIVDVLLQSALPRQDHAAATHGH